MRNLVAAALLAALGMTTVQAEEAMKHPKLLAAGLGLGAVIVEDGKVTTKYATPGASQDAWRLADGSILAVGMKGVVRYDADGKKTMEFKPEVKGRYEIHTCQPLPDGHVLVAVNGPGELVELDAAGKVVKTIKVPGLSQNAHMQMRNVRRRPNGEFAIVASDLEKVILLNADGSPKREIDVRKILADPLKTHKLHGLVPLKNGHLLLGTGAGKCMVELDGNDRVVWSLSPEDVPELGLYYIAGMHRLPNGNTVVSAYRSQYTLFEVTPEKKVLRKVPGKGLGTLTHVQVLDVQGDPAKGELEK